MFFSTEGTGLTADELADRLRAQGVQISTIGRFRARACTHLDVDREAIDFALAATRRVLAG